MTGRFQTELDKTLIQHSEVMKGQFFVWHPPDGMGPWRPGDWIFGSGADWGVIEAKQCKGHIFPAATWTPQQRQFAGRVRSAGGYYWLVVNFDRGEDSRGQTLVYDGFAALKILEFYDRLDWRVDALHITEGHKPRRWCATAVMSWIDGKWSPLEGWLL